MGESFGRILKKAIVVLIIAAVAFGTHRLFFDKNKTNRYIDKNSIVYSAIETVNNERDKFVKDVKNITSGIEKMFNSF